MRVEKVGSCGDSKNSEVLKRARAKAFAQHTPAQAVKLMRRQGIPEDEIPEEHQVKNQRYKLSKDKKLSVVPVESLDELRKFVANPPKGVCFLDEHMVVSEEKIVIPFCLEDSEKTNQILQDSELAAFLMDFTFQVNKEGLVVGSAGPVGLRVSETRAPVMSFLPVILMISTKEDGFLHPRAHFDQDKWHVGCSMEMRCGNDASGFDKLCRQCNRIFASYPEIFARLWISEAQHDYCRS